MATGKWLTYEDRKKIEKMYAAGESVGDIAQSMEKNRATIYKELHKGTTGQMDANGRPGYSAKAAQEYSFKTRYGDKLEVTSGSEK